MKPRNLSACLFCVLSALVLHAAPAQALPDNTWLVAIGNNEGDPDEVSLHYAERDATQIAAVLAELGGVAPHRTVMLHGSRADQVRRALIDVNARIKSSGDDDTALVVFYSGHADAGALHLGGSHLDFSELRDLVAGSPANLRLLVVDACRSGGVSRVKGLRATKSFELKLEDRTEAEGLAIITSSAAREVSQESDRLRSSFFSHHLVNALRGAADREGDGRITLSEAYAYTYSQTLRSSGRTLELQHPTYAFDVKGRGEVVLARLDRGERRLGRLRLRDPGMYLVSEAREGGPVVAELSPPEARTMVALPAGEYFVQERRSEEYREYEISLDREAIVDLATHPHRSVRYDRLVRKRGGPATLAHGLLLMGGVRGETLPGEGPTGQAVLGYGFDAPWFSPGVRFRATSVSDEGDDGMSPRRRSEYALGLTFQRFVDLQHFSFAFGVLIEGALVHQEFKGSRATDPRHSFSAGFGALFSVERHLYEGMSVRVEGGPYSSVFRRARVQRGAEQGSRWETPLTFWAAGGLMWRL